MAERDAATSGPAPLFGALEAGGTKFVCLIGTGPDDIRARIRIPTTTPDETIPAAVAFFQKQRAAHGPIAALGIGSFGPVDLNRHSPAYGTITSTPKPGWRNTDLVGPFARALGIPVAFDTDANGAARGERRWGAGRGLKNFVYVTIGTGIGGGIVSNGEFVHGLVHPEIGHMPLPQNAAADPFPGACPFHGNCLEGLASGHALEKRWGKTDALPADHPAWVLEAHYLALMCVNLTLILSPERIILGGGVMAQAQLFPMIRRRLTEILNGYVEAPALRDGIEDYIVPPGLGGDAGALGALALAERALSG